MTDLGLTTWKSSLVAKNFMSQILVPVVFGGIIRDFSIKIFQSYQGPTTSLHDKYSFNFAILSILIAN